MPDYTKPPLPFLETGEVLAGLPSGATVLLLGAPDTGKTTFLRETCAALAAQGRTVAIVDCDLGQSEIGPPGTVGAALVFPGAMPKSLRDIPPLAAYFVGAVSPSRHPLDLCVGACQMARLARKRRPDLTLVDTDGWVQGPRACHLKRRLCELLLPHVVLAFARGAELDPLLAAFAHLKTPLLWRVAVPAEIGRKTPAARATRRAARFLAAFDGAEPLSLSLDAVALVGSDLGGGAPLPHHVQQWIGQTLNLTVLHAARLPDGAVFVVVHGDRAAPVGLAAIEAHFQTSAVRLVSARNFAHLLVGLINPSGALLDLGLIERIDFDRRVLTLLTRCRRPAAVAQVWLGGLRLRPDGKELGEVKPGDL